MLSVYWNDCPAGAGGAPIWPAVTCWLCCCSELITSLGCQSARLQLLGIEPDPHGVLAGAEHVDVADARAGATSSSLSRMVA